VEYIKSASKSFETTVRNRSGDYGVIAVQGPNSGEILRGLGLLARGIELPYFCFEARSFKSAEVLLARIGYTGEYGYELLIDANRVVDLWQHVVREGSTFGLKECGFHAANSLRIEAGYILFTNELRYRITPYSLGYGRLVRHPVLHRYIGASGLRKYHTREPQVRLVGLVPVRGVDPASAMHREGDQDDWVRPPPVADGRMCLTSLAWSPLFRRWLGMGYVHSRNRYPGTQVEGADGMKARVMRLPFFDPPRVRVRD